MTETAQPTARQQVAPFVLFRNVMIVVGIVAAGGLCFWRYNRDFKPATNDTAKVEPRSGSPIVVQSAQPPQPRLLQLNSPQSLDSARGRAYLTGNDDAAEATHPLEALPIDRQYDHAVVEVPEPSIEYKPPPPAPDEAHEGGSVETPSVDYGDLAQLDAEPRKLGEEAANSLTEAVKIQNSAKPDSPAYYENQSKVVKMMREARDKLYKAIELAPDAPVLTDLMQQVKYVLYNASKTGRK